MERGVEGVREICSESGLELEGEVDVSRVVKLDKRNWRERFDEQKGRAKRGGEERVLMKWHRHSSLFIRREIRRRLYSHRFEITFRTYRVLFFILYYFIIIRDSHLFAKRSWLENWISRFLLGWVNISKGCYGCWVLSRFDHLLTLNSIFHSTASHSKIIFALFIHTPINRRN